MPETAATVPPARPRVTGDQGWNALTHALAKTSPTNLYYSQRARKHLRAMTKGR